MLNGIWLALLGVLAVPSLILSKRPDAAEVLAKIAPYQGWIGVVSAIWGVWGIISSLLHVSWMSLAPIFWLTWLANSVLLACLGLILGIGTFKTFIKDPAAQSRMDETLARMAPHQGRLGIAAIVLGIWMIASSLLWRVG
jgi:hypothetical protein